MKSSDSLDFIFWKVHGFRKGTRYTFHSKEIHTPVYPMAIAWNERNRFFQSWCIYNKSTFSTHCKCRGLLTNNKLPLIKIDFHFYLLLFTRGSSLLFSLLITVGNKASIVLNRVRSGLTRKKIPFVSGRLHVFAIFLLFLLERSSCRDSCVQRISWSGSWFRFFIK